jgi:CheY-like chemotaxis protein
MDEMRTPVDVLIVDDVQENLLEVETLLRGDERNLILAETGEQALEALPVRHRDQAAAASHTKAEFTHAICESCAEEVYPDE